MISDERANALAIEELLARDEELFIQGAYRALLGREPDPEGLGNYMEQLLNGTSKIDLLAAIALSRESRMRAGALGDAILNACERIRSMSAPEATSLDQLLGYHDEQFVRCAYLTLLGRNADGGGLRHYVAQLRAGFSKMRVLSSLRDSDESRARAAEEGDDARALRRAVDRACRKYKWAGVPVVGRVLGLLLGAESDTATQVRLRRLENRLFLLGDSPSGTSTPSQGAAQAAAAKADERSEAGSGAHADVLVKPAASIAPLLSTLPSTVDGDRSSHGLA